MALFLNDSQKSGWLKPDETVLLNLRWESRSISHQSYEVRTPSITQEMTDWNLESLGCGPSGWYNNVLKWKKKRKHKMGWLQVSADSFLFLLQHASFKLTSSISAMTAQFSDISTSPRKINTWNQTFKKLISIEINSLSTNHLMRSALHFWHSPENVSCSTLYDVIATFYHLFQHLGVVMPLQCCKKYL